MSSNGFTVESHFAGKDGSVRKIYERLLKNSRKFGSVIEDPKKTSIHFEQQNRVRGRRHAQERNHPHDQERSQAFQSAHSQI